MISINLKKTCPRLRPGNRFRLCCLILWLFLSFLFSGCILHDVSVRESLRKRGIEVPEPLRAPLPEPGIDEPYQPWEHIRLNALKVQPEEAIINSEERFKATPDIPPARTGGDIVKQDPGTSESKMITVNFDALPLSAFINDVYGGILKKSFEIDSSLRNKRDLITLRAEKPMSPSELDRLARQVLENYGVAAESRGELLRFAPGRGTFAGEPPLLVSGGTLPEVPISHRPVFQLVPLSVVRNVHVAGWLKQAYKGQKLEIFEDPERNAILLMGAPVIIEQALKAIRVLDQPYMRGRHSVRIEPIFVNAEELSRMLLDVLNSEGYSATPKPPMGSVIVLPIKQVNAVIVFAADPSVLEHVKDWARTLDHPGRKPEGDTGFFYYQVRNTRAKKLAELLERVMSGDTKTGDTKTGRLNKSRLVVDEVRNGLIFQGDAEAWARLLPVITQVDRPARMVLIEVTVAEVTLTDQEELGLEWLLINDATMGLKTMGGLDIGTKGMNYILNNAGQTRLLINAFAANSRVSILSTPRIMVKSGEEATIDVGTEVPIITSQSTASDLQQNGNSAILQQVQYRKTGVLLSVNPVVHSGNRVDLEITQEVSESETNNTSNITSPTILNRKISTAIELKDGGSVLLGGLISSSINKGYSGVPLLSKIPVLGRLFRVEKSTEERTEMIMLIVPYIIDNSQDAEAITESFQKQLRNVPVKARKYSSDQKALGKVVPESDKDKRYSLRQKGKDQINAEYNSPYLSAQKRPAYDKQEQTRSESHKQPISGKKRPERSFPADNETSLAQKRLARFPSEAGQQDQKRLSRTESRTDRRLSKLRISDAPEPAGESEKSLLPLKIK